MLLVCPNCGARYEVPQVNIPESGRDVQCSACSMTWFQTSPHLPKPQLEALNDAVEGDPTVILPASNYLPITGEVLTDRKNLEKLPREDNARQLKNRLHPTVSEVLKEEAQREVAARATENMGKQPNPRFEKKETSNLLMKGGEGDVQSVSLRDGILEDKLDNIEDRQAEAQDNTKEPETETSLHNEHIHPKVSSGAKEYVKKSSDENVSHNRKSKMARMTGFLAGLSTVAIFFFVYQQESELTNLFYPLRPVLERYVTSVDLLRTYSDQWFANGIYWLESQVGN